MAWKAYIIRALALSEGQKLTYQHQSIDLPTAQAKRQTDKQNLST